MFETLQGSIKADREFMLPHIPKHQALEFLGKEHNVTLTMSEYNSLLNFLNKTDDRFTQARLQLIFSRLSVSDVLWFWIFHLQKYAAAQFSGDFSFMPDYNVNKTKR